MIKVSDEVIEEMQHELVHALQDYPDIVFPANVLRHLAVATAAAATQHADVAAKANQDASRAREADLAQNLFNAQQALNIVGGVCGIARGMPLVSAVPKLVQKVVADRDWTQEQVTHLSVAKARLEHELEDLRPQLEALRKRAEDLDSKLAAFYPSPANSIDNERMVKPSDLPVPAPAPTEATAPS